MAHLYILTGLLALSACDSVPIHDEIFYGNKGMHGAVLFHTLAPETEELSFDQWMTVLRKEPLVCSSVTTFGDIKGAVEKLCSVCNCCSYDQKVQLQEFFQRAQKASQETTNEVHKSSSSGKSIRPH